MTTYNFPSHIKGDTFDGAAFTLTLNGAAIDLTDSIITMDVRLVKTGVSAKRFTSVANENITITVPLEGKFEINNQVVDINAGRYFYDIQIEFPDGTIKTYISGTWTIVQDVTYD